MSLTIQELWDSQSVERTVDTASAVLRYIIFPTTDEPTAYTSLLAYAPATYGGYLRQKVNLKALGAGYWIGEVEFGFSAVSQDNTSPTIEEYTDATELGPEFTFDITAQQAHITQSLNTRYRYSLPSNSTSGAYLKVFGNPTAGSPSIYSIVYPTAPDTYIQSIGDIGKFINVSGGTGWAVGSYRILRLIGGTGYNLQIISGNIVKPDSYTVVAEDINTTIVISAKSSGEWTAGTYTITAVDTVNNYWALSAVPGTPAGLGGGVWKSSQVYWVLDSSPAASGTGGGIWGISQFPTTVNSSAIASGVALQSDAANAWKVTPDNYSPNANDVFATTGRYLLISGADGIWSGGAYQIASISGSSWILSNTAGGINGPSGTGNAPAPLASSGGKWSLIPSITYIGGAPNYKRAIGVTRDRVEGTDIYVPHFEFTLTFQFFPVLLPYIRTIRALAGKINSYPFRNFNAGEVLFLGATGRCGADYAWTITFKFAVGQNLFAVPVSDDIIIPFKGAWDYLWCVYQDSPAAGSVIQSPKYAYVEQVMQYADFTPLGIN